MNGFLKAVVAGLIAFFLFFLLLCGLVWPFEMVVYFFAGWIFFLARVVPQLQVSAGGIATGVVALVAFVVGLHRFMAWLYPLLARDDVESSQQASRWKRNWTLASVTVLLLMFIAGIGMVGTTHQIVWLFTSKEPLLASGFNEIVRRNTSQNNLKEIGLGIHNYSDVHNRALPADTVDPQGRDLHSWITRILPYMEEFELYQMIDQKQPWNSEANAPHFRTQVVRLRNPSIKDREELDAQGFAVTNYAANAWALGGDQPRTMKDFKDGLSKTILAGEAAGNFPAWGRPGNARDPRLGVNRSPNGFGGNRKEVTIFLYGDGSVRMIYDDIDSQLFEALCTPGGGESVVPPE